MSEHVNKKRTLLEQQSVSHPTTQTTNFVNLSRILFHVIIGEYLNLKDVARFDNAVLNHQDRLTFLCNVSNMVTKSSGRIIYEANCSKWRGTYLLRWLYQRKILLSKFSMNLRHINNVKASMFVAFPLNVSLVETLLLSRDYGKDSSFSELLKRLALCTNLKYLNFYNENNDSVAHLEGLFIKSTFCHCLEIIKLGASATDNVISKLATESPLLHTIELSFGATVSDNIFIDFVEKRGHLLKNIIICNGTTLTNVANHIAENCPLLEHLEASLPINDSDLVKFGQKLSTFSAF